MRHSLLRLITQCFFMRYKHLIFVLMIIHIIFILLLLLITVKIAASTFKMDNYIPHTNWMHNWVPQARAVSAFPYITKTRPKHIVKSASSWQVARGIRVLRAAKFRFQRSQHVKEETASLCSEGCIWREVPARPCRFRRRKRSLLTPLSWPHVRNTSGKQTDHV